MINNNAFLRVNEVSEPLNAIMMIKHFLEHSAQDNYNLKWAIIAAHNALQGFMVLALKGTSSFPVTQSLKGEAIQSIDDFLANPNNRKLLNFLSLYKKIKNDKDMHNAAFKDESGLITKSINILNAWRNQFLHNLPCNWSLPIQEIFYVLTDTMKVISFLTENCTEVQKHYDSYSDESKLSELRGIIESCNSILLVIVPK